MSVNLDGAKIERIYDAFKNPTLLFLNCPIHFLMTTAALEGELENLAEPSVVIHVSPLRLPIREILPFLECIMDYTDSF